MYYARYLFFYKKTAFFYALLGHSALFCKKKRVINTRLIFILDYLLEIVITEPWLYTPIAGL